MPLAIVRAGEHAGLAVEEIRETEDAARARVHGARFIAAIDDIRRKVGTDEPYLLIDEGLPDEGAANWVRYELAPRRAILLRGEARSARWLRQHVPAGIRWVVVAPGRHEPPALYPRFQYFRERAGGEPGR